MKASYLVVSSVGLVLSALGWMGLLVQDSVLNFHIAIFIGSPLFVLGLLGGFSVINIKIEGRYKSAGAILGLAICIIVTSFYLAQFAVTHGEVYLPNLSLVLLFPYLFFGPMFGFIGGVISQVVTYVLLGVFVGWIYGKGKIMNTSIR